MGPHFMLLLSIYVLYFNVTYVYPVSCLVERKLLFLNCCFNCCFNVGLRQGCVMSPWLFNVYMDGVVGEVNLRVHLKGLELLSKNGGRFEINQLLFADDTALVADSEEKLCSLVSEFGRVCERRKLRVNLGKSKVMRCSRYGNGDRMHVILNSEPLEEVDCFKYLGSQVAADGGCEMDVVQRMNER